MRKTLIPLLAFIILFSGAHSQNSISGLVSYKNLAQTPMSSINGNTTVVLKQNNNIIYQAVTNNLGQYQFVNITPGLYTLTSTCSKPSGGVNAVDALQICTSGFSMSGLIRQAGDVNGSGNPNSADALAVLRFFVGQINNFQPPNIPFPGNELWVSDSFYINILNNSNISQDIYMLCTGDVNGSNIPPP